MSAMNEFVEP